MKKLFLYIAALALAVGCNDYMDEDMGALDSNFSGETVFVNLDLSIEEGVSDTRVSVTPGDSDTDPWETEWEDGDVIYVYSIEQEAYTTLTYAAEGNSGGTFSGDVYPGKNRIYCKNGSIYTSYYDETRLVMLSANANFTDGGTPLMISSEVINIDATDSDDSSTTYETIDVDMKLLSTAINFRMTFTGIPDDMAITLTSIELGSKEDGYISIPYSKYSYPDKDIDSDDFYYSTVSTGQTLFTDIALENDTEYSVKFEAFPFDLAAGEKLLVTLNFNNGGLSKSFDFSNNTGSDFEFARATHNYLEKTYDLSDILDDLFIFTDTWVADAVAFADTTSAGTEADPIEIASEEELAYLAKITTGLYTGLSSEGLYYKLTADLDLGDKLWYPIGGSVASFSGNFDGGGHTISNLTISSENSYQGLFGRVVGNSEDDIAGAVSCISNLKIKDPNVSSDSSYVGALCGYIAYGSISNCSVEGGSVTSSSSYVGGVCSYLHYSSISNCSVEDCSVTGSNYVGGVCGYLFYDSSISNCSVEDCSVTGNSSVGGVCGRLTNDCSISNCSIEGGSVTGSSSYVGGVCGYLNYSSISNCSVEGGSVTGAVNSVGGVCGNLNYSSMSNCSVESGSVTGSSYVGGVVGRLYCSGIITKCYNEGAAVYGYSNVGGLVGYAYGSSSDKNSISECYNKGCVVASLDYSSSTTATATYSMRSGGVAGFTLYTNITNCYNSGDISGEYGTGGVVGQCGMYSSIVACYNVGSVAEGSYLVSGYGYACGSIVGLIPYSDSSITACYGTSLSDYMIGYYAYATASNCYCLYPTELVNEEYSESFDATGFNSAQLTSVADLNAKVDDMNTAANTALETTGVVYFTAGSDDNTLPSLMGETFEYGSTETETDSTQDFTSGGGLSD